MRGPDPISAIGSAFLNYRLIWRSFGNSLRCGSSILPEDPLFEKQIKISRIDLYERVWTTPLRTLAKEFGLSDVGLAKLCRRHGIPLPGRGYWVRHAVRQKAGTDRLARCKRCNCRDNRHHCPGVSIIRERPPARSVEYIDVQIPEGDSREHPIASKIAKAFVKARLDDNGMLVPQSGQISAVGLTSDSLSRGLRLYPFVGYSSGAQASRVG